MGRLEAGKARISIAREAKYDFFAEDTIIYVGGRNLGAMSTGDRATVDVHPGTLYLSVKTKSNPGSFQVILKVKPGMQYFFEVTPRTKDYQPTDAFKLFGEDAVISQNLGPFQLTAVNAKRLLKAPERPKVVYTPPPPPPTEPVISPEDIAFEEAQALMQRGDQAGAYQKFLPLAENGHADSQYALSNLYFMGIYVDKNPMAGLNWLKKAADQGQVDALGLLANFYLSGEFIKKNVKEALNLRLEAALTGDALSQYNLATIYLRDDLGYKNLFEAVRFLNDAAEQNLQLAQYNLGAMYMNGQGAPLDYIKAYLWFFLAANRNGQGAQNVVAMDSSEVAGAAMENVSILKEKMSGAQLSRAREIVSKWKPKANKTTP